MLDPKIEQIIKRYAEQIRTKFEIHELILFGSYARGTATAESDVDLAVVFKNEIQARAEVLIELCDLAYEILLETDIDISPSLESQQPHSLFCKAPQPQKIDLHFPDETCRFQRLALRSPLLESKGFCNWEIQ